VSLSATRTSHNAPEVAAPYGRWLRSPNVLVVVALAMGLSGLPAGAVAAESLATSLVSTSSSWYTSLVETGFYQAFSLVFLSELGDKTFFIAGLLAMKTSRIISLIGSLAALIVMTILSVVIGQIFHVMPSLGIADGIPLDDIAAALAFAFFGVKLLKEAIEMEEGASAMDEEFAEAEEAVKENQKVVSNSNKLSQIFSIFTLVFAAEFGDRSFLSTIALSAAQNPVAVAGGAIAAHTVATGIAVAGGAVVAKYLSERVIGLIGGTLFLVFAATTALGIF
jgi:putative Ca2+/H+ antiporter (TMEM165/GDT1 family)